MKKQWFELRTDSRIIVSGFGVTEGIHQSLDYIPGSALLGVAARKWDKFNPGILLNGSIRISNAYPVLAEDGEGMMLPVPMSYHAAKSGEVGKYYNGLHDLGAFKDIQLEQVRKGFVTPAGMRYVSSIPSKISVKTAIDRTRHGAAKEAQLFTYGSISDGLLFRFSVEADGAVSPDVFQAVCGCFDGLTRIGRSRSAEFGSATIRPIEDMLHPSGDPIPWPDSHKRVIVYFESDAILDHDGIASTRPRPADFLLDDAVILWNHSFIRTRSYSPWNQYFGRRMTMRNVISSGSVVSFDTGRDWSAQDLRNLQARLDSGIGQYVNEGLGRVRINPEFVMSESPVLRELQNREDLRIKPRSDDKIERPETPLVTLLEERLRRTQRAGEAVRIGMKWSESWLKFMRSLEKENARVPGKSQWSNLRELAVRFRETKWTEQKEQNKFLLALKKHCTRPDKNDPAHHRSTRHQFWDTSITCRTADGQRNSMSMYEQIVEELFNRDLARRELQMPGLIIDAFLQAVIAVTRKLDMKKDRR